MSCSGRNHKNCNYKSCQRYYNNNPQAVAVSSNVQLIIEGTKVVDTGVSIETYPQNYTTLKTGLYHISGDVVVTATAAGLATLQVYMDGIPLPCTLKPITLAVGANPVHTETDLQIDGCCADVSHVFTYVLTTDATATGNVTQFCSGIVKLA